MAGLSSGLLVWWPVCCVASIPAAVRNEAPCYRSWVVLHCCTAATVTGQRVTRLFTINSFLVWLFSPSNSANFDSSTNINYDPT